MALTSTECRGFDDIYSANAVDEVDQPAIVDGDVVGGGTLLAGGRIGEVVADFAGSERVCDVDEAQALGEPANGITLPWKRSDG